MSKSIVSITLWIRRHQRQITVVAAFASSLVGAVKYFDERTKDREQRQVELDWQRSRFIFELADNSEKDLRFQLALRMLAGQESLPIKSSLSRILAKESDNLSTDEVNARYAFDRFLDFFDRMAYYTDEIRILRVNDVRVFRWDLAQIINNDDLRSYACREGFKRAVQLAQEVRNIPNQKGCE